MSKHEGGRASDPFFSTRLNLQEIKDGSRRMTGDTLFTILQQMYEARKNGYDEALMLDDERFVAEGPAENIFLVESKTLATPNSRSALPGITRKSILEISKDIGLKSYERKVTLEQAKNADELFFCGTATEIAPIISVDGKKIGDGKAGEITLKIRDKFYNIVRGKDRKYEKWLTYVY